MALDLDIDLEISGQLNDDIVNSGAIRLPVEVPYFFIMNGEPKMAAVGGPQHFGGWAVDRQELSDAGQYWDPPIVAPPSYFGSHTFFTNDGKQLPVFESRSVICALIGSRVSWAIKTGDSTRRFKEYVPGARRHMQVLVYLADKTPDKKLAPWGPAVLTASGYQVGHLIKGFQNWKAAVEKILRAEKSPATPWMFYTSCGTFGDTFKQEMVGPEGAKSPITPVTTQVPKDMDADLLKKLYVSREVAAQMAGFKAEAREWLDAWKNLPGAGQPGQPPATGHYPPEPPADMWPAVQPPDDDIPF